MSTCARSAPNVARLVIIWFSARSASFDCADICACVAGAGLASSLTEAGTWTGTWLRRGHGRERDRRCRREIRVSIPWSRPSSLLSLPVASLSCRRFWSGATEISLVWWQTPPSRYGERRERESGEWREWRESDDRPHLPGMDWGERVECVCVWRERERVVSVWWQIPPSRQRERESSLSPPTFTASLSEAFSPSFPDSMLPRFLGRLIPEAMIVSTAWSPWKIRLGAMNYCFIARSNDCN